MTVRYLVGDVFEMLAKIPDDSVDLVMGSPPFLALRSYLPADHPDKGKEIGSERTPADFLDVLLRLTADLDRVIAPHGSLVFELGDTYSSSGGAGGRDDQRQFSQADGDMGRPQTKGTGGPLNRGGGLVPLKAGRGWPLAKSLCGIPTLYAWSLAYGRNLLTGEPSPAGMWRIRNLIAWVRPNPPVGALCVDDQTEALTPDGWKRHTDLRDGDLIAAYDRTTDSCRFLPAQIVRFHRENEPLVAIEKQATSQRFTDDHRTWVRTRKLAPHVRLARDLTNECQTLLCAPFDDVPGHAPVTAERAAILGWFIAEGTPRHRQARIVQSVTANSQHVERIRALLNADGADYRETTYLHPGESTIATFIIKGELAEWLNLHHKRLPMTYATTWPERQAQALFDALIDGDGHRRAHRGILFHQQTESIADAVQVLALRLGYRASKTWQPSLRIWQVTMSRAPVKDRRWTKLRKWNGSGIPRETYTGTVWCPIVETSLWLARRGGKTFITGNSDKFRPATSYLIVACRSGKRWFDLDAVRNVDMRVPSAQVPSPKALALEAAGEHGKGMPATGTYHANGGAPPLDWWKITPKGYKGAHYAVYPPELCERPIKAMCPLRVCTVCGEPSRRVTQARFEPHGDPAAHNAEAKAQADYAGQQRNQNAQGMIHGRATKHVETLGWTDCGHDAWRPGMVLDPFAGTGTTLLVANDNGRDAIGIDLNPANIALARERIGIFLEVA